MALGIDIYRSFQTVHDWPAVKRHGVGYVYVKLSDGGGTPVGGRGDAEVNGAKSVGIPVGGYHFVQASPTPERQADVLLGEVARLDATGCVPMLDLEDNPPGSRLPNIPDRDKRAFAEAFLNRLDARGFRPGVYLNNALAKQLRPDRWNVPGLVIWIARYGARPDPAAGRYDLHQYSAAGAVPGITARGVDLDESYTTAHLGARKSGTPAPVQEDDMPAFGTPAKAGTNQHTDIAVVGCTKLRIHTSFGNKVAVRAILFYGDTGADPNGTGVGGGYDGEFRTPKEAWTWAPNRPGPVTIPAGATTCTVLYDAGQDFYLSAAAA